LMRERLHKDAVSVRASQGNKPRVPAPGSLPQGRVHDDDVSSPSFQTQSI
jgi:hypothetical protein